MTPPPVQIRLWAALALFAALASAVFWAGRPPAATTRFGRSAAVPMLRGFGGFGRASIDGVVLGTDGRPTHAEVSLVMPVEGRPMRGGADRGRRAAAIRTADDGRFSINFVAAGRYLLVAHATAAEEGSDNLWAAAEVVLADQAHAATRLKLKRSGGLSGQIVIRTFGTTAAPDLTDTTVALEPVDSDAKAALLEGVPRVSVTADGRFLLAEIPPGQYRLTASLRVPWMVDALTANGRDSLDQPISVAPGAYVTDAVVTATNVPSRFDGDARDAAGHPLPFALLFAFASDPSLRSLNRRTQAVRANASGHFTLTGLPSGDYLVGVAPHGDASTWYTPGFLADLARQATHVRLTVGARQEAVVRRGPQ